MSLLHSWEVWKRWGVVLGHPGLYNLICPVWVLEGGILASSMARPRPLLGTLTVGLKPCPPPIQGVPVQWESILNFQTQPATVPVGLKQGLSQVNDPQTDKGHKSP